MGAKHDGIIRWNRCRGRNGFDPPDTLPDDMAAEATNVLFDRAGLVRKRYGYGAVDFAGGTEINAQGAYWGMGIVPSQTKANGLFLVALGNGQFVYLDSASGENALTEANINDGNKWEVSGAVINGKMYVAYNSDENRLHVWHVVPASTIIRRSGLETPAAPTVANQGGGATYAAIVRRYRVQWVTLVSSANQRQSLLGASVSFTPSGAGDAARVTQPTPPGEGETHWRVYGTASSTDENAAWFQLSSDIVIATTFYDDSAAPSTYDDNDPAPEEGAFTPWPSVKYLATDGQRLLGFGVWESSQGDAMEPLAGRVYISPVLDTSDYDDDERVSNTTDIKGTIDIGRNIGVVDRGIAGPINGEFLVGQSHGVTILSPTGDPVDPFTQRKLSSSIGFVSHASAFVGEDEAGNPCIYFLDPLRGPYRYGVNGLEWCGYDIQDIWATVNLNATSLVAHGVWYEPAKTCVWYVATSSSNVPSEVIYFNAKLGVRTQSQGVRYGWSRGTMAGTPAYHSTTWYSSMGGSGSIENPAIWLLPGQATAEELYHTGLINLPSYTPSSFTDDAGTDFQGLVASKVFTPFAPNRGEVVESYLDANAASGVTITQTLTRNYGDETARTRTVSLTAAGSETRHPLKKFEDTHLVDVDAFQVTLGDASASDAQWTLHGWMGLLKKNQEK